MWIDVVAAVVLLFGIYAFIELAGFRTRWITAAVERTARACTGTTRIPRVRSVATPSGMGAPGTTGQPTADRRKVDPFVLKHSLPFRDPEVASNAGTTRPVRDAARTASPRAGRGSEPHDELNEWQDNGLVFPTTIGTAMDNPRARESPCLPSRLIIRASCRPDDGTSSARHAVSVRRLVHRGADRRREHQTVVLHSSARHAVGPSSRSRSMRFESVTHRSGSAAFDATSGHERAESASGRRGPTFRRPAVG